MAQAKKKSTNSSHEFDLFYHDEQQCRKYRISILFYLLLSMLLIIYKTNQVYFLK